MLAARACGAASVEGTPLNQGSIELAQLLGIYENLGAAAESGEGSQPRIASLAERFKGMQGSFASTSAQARQLAAAAGLTVSSDLQVSTPAASAAGGELGAADCQPVSSSGSRLGLPPVADYAAKLIAELDPECGTSGTDLLLLHLDIADLAVAAAAAQPRAQQQQQGEQAENVKEADDEDMLYDVSLEALEWLDSLVKLLLQDKGCKERVLLSLALSSQGKPTQQQPRAQQQQQQQTGAQQQHPQQQQVAMRPGGAAIDPSAYVVTPRSAMMMSPAVMAAQGMAGLSLLDDDPVPPVARPLQSWQQRGVGAAGSDGRQRVERVHDVLEHAPMLVVRRLPGVIRRDRAERLNFAECNARGGQGCILADRLLAEVAYKVGRAPKYGA